MSSSPIGGSVARVVLLLCCVASKAQDLGGEIDLVVMDGRLKATTDEVAEWVRATALANANFWRGFPVAHTTVVILPASGEARVLNGEVSAAGGVMVFISVSSDISRRALYDDWILEHEFILLGTPAIGDLRDNGELFNYGLADYLEPVVRYRAGWLSEESLWEQLASLLDESAKAMNQGLEGSDSPWGSIGFALMADVELRQLSAGRALA